MKQLNFKQSIVTERFHQLGKELFFRLAIVIGNDPSVTLSVQRRIPGDRGRLDPP